jgi:hypothetical protein
MRRCCVGVAFFVGCTHIGESDIARPYASTPQLRLREDGATSIGPAGRPLRRLCRLDVRYSEPTARGVVPRGARRIGVPREGPATESPVEGVEPRSERAFERARNDVNPVRQGCNIPRTELEPEPPRW